MITKLYKKIIQPFLKKKNLPYCLHKWECVNPQEERMGFKAVYKCSRCNEYLN